MNKALEDFAIGALMYENNAPIAEAGRLVPFSPDYTSVVVNKGAMVFHMLREQLGDSAFFALCGISSSSIAARRPTLADFEKLAQDHADQLNSNAAAGSAQLRPAHNDRLRHGHGRNRHPRPAVPRSP